MTTGGDEAAWRPAPVRAQPSEQLDGYTGLVEVGRGGDSVVYRADQTSMGREVAIKVLLVDDPVRSARFQREIQITVGLGRQHPNIVNVLDVGTTASGRPAIVMDFHEGGTLHDRLRSFGPLPADEVGRIGEVLADALSFAHDRGVLHRDVKPQNVLVLPTSWVLADFGIARLTDSEHTSSAETFTYRHAAPQVLDGYAPSPADDVWSLGSTLYTLLDGRPPFASDDPDDDSALAYLRRVRVEAHRPLRAPGSERIAPIVERCLAKDVADRWASAAELRDAFHGLRASAWEPAGASPPTGLRPGLPPAAPIAPAPVGVAPDRTAQRPAAPPDRTPPPAPAPVAGPPPVPPRPPEAPPEPPPVALSVASHRPEVADELPTGTGLPLDLTGPDPRRVDPRGPDRPDGPGGRSDDGAPPRRSRLPLILVAVAVVIGLALYGVGHLSRRGGDAVPVVSATTTDTSITTLTSPPPDVTDFQGRFDPKLTMHLTEFTYDNVASLHLAWTDPSEGEGVFYLERVSPDPKPIAMFAAGQTTFDLATTLPLGRSCYYMIVRLATGEIGRSDLPRCWTVPKPS